MPLEACPSREKDMLKSASMLGLCEMLIMFSSEQATRRSPDDFVKTREIIKHFEDSIRTRNGPEEWVFIPITDGSPDR